MDAYLDSEPMTYLIENEGSFVPSIKGPHQRSLHILGLTKSHHQSPCSPPLSILEMESRDPERLFAPTSYIPTEVVRTSGETLHPNLPLSLCNRHEINGRNNGDSDSSLPLTFAECK
ncbi:hypothetical protein SAY86_018173 [Trapa natans]|uniref:Uncharacterized protein n=1 Tax=Trapa natans TaxID=22666 RepID=A0AAN7LMJ2_TRANT|nr:hypothetical protein SAY86_018173 [Trapa natans]